MATPTGKVKLTVDIPLELKQEFKVFCAINQLNMTQVVESLIEMYLKEYKPKKEGAI
jgi:hypothetical protein